jgi:hypothetical protein
MIPVAAAEPRQALLVVGMHRSGTSALAGTFASLGAQQPASVMPGTEDNPRGYFESVDIMEFDQRVLASAGRAWDDWRPWPAEWIVGPEAARFREELGNLLRREYGGALLPLIKDPRMCRFLPLWTEVLAAQGYAPVVLLCLRNPFEVAQSLNRRDGMPQEQALLLWLQHVLDAERDTRLLPRRAVDYERLLDDPVAEAKETGGRLGIPWPRPLEDAAPDITAFLSRELRHQRMGDVATQVGREGASDWAARAYEALLSIDDQGKAADAQSRLDAIRAEFDAAYLRFGPVLAELHERAASAEQRADTVPVLHDEMGRQAREIASLTRRVADAEGIMLDGSARADAVEGSEAGHGAAKQ